VFRSEILIFCSGGPLSPSSGFFFGLPLASMRLCLSSFSIVVSLVLLGVS